MRSEMETSASASRLTLDVDGVRTEAPSAADIAIAFESLGRGKGWFTGPGISLISLEKDKAHSLTATGTYAEGFLLSHQDGDPNCEYNADFAHVVTVDEAIKIFRAYARGEDWGQSNFKWKPFILEDKTSNIVKRLLVIGILGYLIYIVVKLIEK